MKLQIFIFFLVSVCRADPIFRVDHGTNQSIDKFGICEKITNASATKDIMAPANSSGEWAAFLAHLPASVSKSTCSAQPPSPGYVGRGYSNFVHSSGKVYLGGDVSPYLARLNSDGSLDLTFSLAGTGIGSTWSDISINSIAVQSDGKIVVAGNFLTYNGTTANRILRLNTDGTIDSTFATNAGSGFGATEYISTRSLAVQADGKIIYGGSFSTYNGTSIQTVVRINTDGTRDTSFTPPTSLPETVTSVFVQSDGKILVGGDSYSSVAKNITRLNSDGTVDAGFNKGTSVNNVVEVVFQQSDGKILLGGIFTTYNGVASSRLARLNTDGTLDTAFTTNLAGGFDSIVESIAQQSDGKVLVGGFFTTLNGVNQKAIARLNTDGTKDSTYVNIGSVGVDAVSVFSDNKIFVSGSFCSGFVSSGCYCAKLNADGTM